MRSWIRDVRSVCYRTRRGAFVHRREVGMDLWNMVMEFGFPGGGARHGVAVSFIHGYHRVWNTMSAGA